MDCGIKLSPAQMRKLKSGGAIIFNKSHLMNNSPHRMCLCEAKAKKLQSALRRDKGMKIALGDDEDIYTETEGGKISLKKAFKSVSKPVSKAVKSAAKETVRAVKPIAKEVGQEVGRASVRGAKVVKRGFDKKIVESGVGKRIAKELIDVGTQVLLPAAGAVGSMALGDPTGMSGAMVGQIAGDQLDKYAERQGYGMVLNPGRRAYPGPTGYFDPKDEMRGVGLYKKLHKAGFHKVGINKKTIHKAANVVGKKAVRLAADVGAMAIANYTGSPEAGEAFRDVAIAGGDKAIDSGSVKAGLKRSGSKAKMIAKRAAVEAVDDFIDANLSGASKKVAQKALAGKFPSAKDLIYDYNDEPISTASTLSGYGITRAGIKAKVMRNTAGVRMGKGLAYSTPAYQNAEFMYGAGISDTNYGIIQTGGPFAKMSSPAMNPFIYEASPQLSTKIGGRMCGGSFIPAGRHGGSFVPSG